MSTGKRIVHYSEILGTKHLVPLRGCSARVVPVDHPNTEYNGRAIFTSPVQDIIPVIGDSRPVFLTINSIYIPAPKE